MSYFVSQWLVMSERDLFFFLSYGHLKLVGVSSPPPNPHLFSCLSFLLCTNTIPSFIIFLRRWFSIKSLSSGKNCHFKVWHLQSLNSNTHFKQIASNELLKITQKWNIMSLATWLKVFLSAISLQFAWFIMCIIKSATSRSDCHKTYESQ